MKLSLSVLSSAILVSTAVAAPHSKSGLSRRLQRRAGERPVRDSTMKANNSSNIKIGSIAAAGITSDVSSTQYSGNWAGAVIKAPPADQTFNFVAAKITVPTPSVPAGADSPDDEYSSTAWVGIDGNTYTAAILQTGVDFTVTTSGEVSYSAWYEWFPDYSSDFDLDISAGDVVSMYVNASSSTTGTATVENLTTGQTVTQDLSSTSALGGQNAEWIVEDYGMDGSLVALADFGSVAFTDCVAQTAESYQGVDAAGILDMVDADNNVLTAVTLTSGSSVEVTYTAGSEVTGGVETATNSSSNGTLAGSVSNAAETDDSKNTIIFKLVSILGKLNLHI